MASDYIRIEQYLTSHPEQAQIMDQFSRLVEQPAHPLKNKKAINPVKIAIIYPALQSSDYWRRSVRSFERRLDQLSINYQSKSYFSRSSIDTLRQSNQLKEALAWEPDYLIFTLNSVPQKHMIERLLAKGKPKLILQNITTPLQQWQNNRPFMYVGFDHAQGTKLITHWMLKQREYQGNYLMLYYSPGYISQMRGETFDYIASTHKNIKQVAAYYTDGDFQKSYLATKEALENHKQINIIFANSTDTALGALKALKELNMTDKVLLNGWGGGSTELSQLSTHGLDVTVMRINDDNGIAMAEAIKLDLLSRQDEVPHIFAGKLELLPATTSKEVISQLKRKAFRLSNPVAPTHE